MAVGGIELYVRNEDGELVAATLSAAEATLAGLSDVALDDPQNNDILTYDGDNWVNTPGGADTSNNLVTNGNFVGNANLWLPSAGGHAVSFEAGQSSVEGSGSLKIVLTGLNSHTYYNAPGGPLQEYGDMPLNWVISYDDMSQSAGYQVNVMVLEYDDPDDFDPDNIVDSAAEIYNTTTTEPVGVFLPHAHEFFLAGAHPYFAIGLNCRQVSSIDDFPIANPLLIDNIYVGPLFLT